jgi:glycosyltransferase involved in cell wall biosynthesis
VGGAEQVLTHIDSALVAQGHESLVLACANSRTKGKLFSATECAEPIDDAARARACREYRSRIHEICDEWPVDVVHCHGVDFHEYLPAARVPSLVTLHLPPSWYPQSIFEQPRPNTFFHCVSKTQRDQCPDRSEMLPVVENGVSGYFSELSFRKRNYALALGRICPEKGFHFGAEAARQAGLPLVLGGAIFPYQAHVQYFEREIAPRLGPAFRFVGPLGVQRKRRLLGAARCLLVPSQAPETSSLVAMEALACGTPVIAFRVGALPEIIEHGRTGFIVQNVSEMAEGITAAGALDPNACRQAAHERFSLGRMTGTYLDYYRLLARHRPPPLPYEANRARVGYRYAMSAQ